MAVASPCLRTRNPGSCELPSWPLGALSGVVGGWETLSTIPLAPFQVRTGNELYLRDNPSLPSRTGLTTGFAQGRLPFSLQSRRIGTALPVFISMLALESPCTSSTDWRSTQTSRTVIIPIGEPASCSSERIGTLVSTVSTHVTAGDGHSFNINERRVRLADHSPGKSDVRFQPVSRPALWPRWRHT